MQPIDAQEHLPSLIAPLERCLLSTLKSEQPPGRGKPMTIEWPQLWLGWLGSVLLGMKNYQQFWRRLCSQWSGPFAPVQLSDDALIKRLKQAGIDPWLTLLSAVSQTLASQREGLLPCTLAPFATRIVAIDETTWDAVQRPLKALREVAAGDVGLLAGKLAGRFTLRTQQWELVQWRSHMLANGKVEVLSLWEGLPARSLILFDLGSFSFPWLDDLTPMQDWFVCRLREKVS